MNRCIQNLLGGFLFSGMSLVFACEGQGSRADAQPMQMIDRSVEGDLQMRLQGVGELVSPMDLRVYRPDGTQIATGKIPLPAGQGFANAMMVLPAGLGYTASLSGRSKSGAQCVGTGLFNVVAGQSTDLRLRLVCDAPGGSGSGPGHGNVNIEVDLDAGPADACPEISFVSGLPRKMNVGGTIQLRAAATHASAKFHWSASVGQLSEPEGSDTEYKCTRVGPARVSLLVSAGAACEERQTIELDCLAVAEEGEGPGEPEGGGDAGEGGDQGESDNGALSPLSIRFQPTLAGQAFKCGHRYTGLGTTHATGTIGDFRFFVHDIRLLKEDGTQTPFVLQARDPWQGRGVALVDFEGGPDSGCYGGTKGRNTEITGLAPKGKYSGIRFSIGIPSEISHADPSTLEAPFTAGGMAWSWLAGYKFLKFELGSGLLHVGSTGCTGTPPDQVTCRRANRPQIELQNFDPNTQVIVADLAAAFQSSDLSSNPACHATGEACPVLFQEVGLNFDDGTSTSTQRVFSVQ